MHSLPLHPPGNNISILEDILSWLSTNIGNETIILGDMNINWSSIQSPTNPLNINLYNFSQLIDSITRPSKNLSKGSTLDWILVSHPHKFSNSGTLPDSLSDHFPTFTHRLPSPIHLTHNYIITRNQKNVNPDTFSNSLKLINWNPLKTLPLDTAVAYFNSTFLNLLDCHDPINSKRIKSKTALLLSKNTLNIMHLRDKAWAHHQKNKSPSTLNEYKTLRNKVKKLITVDQQNYFSLLQNNHKTNPQKFWKGISNLLNPSKTKNPNPDPNALGIDLATQFNSFFIDSISKLTSSFPNTSPSTSPQSFSNNSSPSSSASPVTSSPSHPLSNTFSSQPLPFSANPIPTSTIKLLQKLKPCSNSPDNIPSYFLSIAAEAIVLPISILINHSIQEVHVPQIWKKAFIIPLHKGGNNNNISNFRPIAILSPISKILEKCIHLQLLPYLIDNNLLTPTQHGFRPGHISMTALHSFLEIVNKAQDSGSIISTLLLDLSKAFDTISHNLLLAKLSKLNISPSSIN
ncbi:uncharacterized protein LOC122807654 [Protopterus annectens]|uniref:uncharacterized protein LOC122807654 n=1 Tax=Protopterus annectens TaxID=7888 RepID=UPI001CF95066|nr:uncharacterized protein LOC122807654 [Protopterus annectens]